MTKKHLLRTIRKFCLECMGTPRLNTSHPTKETLDYIRDCTDHTCPFYTLRFGKDPDPKPPGSIRGVARRPPAQQPKQSQGTLP